MSKDGNCKVTNFYVVDLNFLSKLSINIIPIANTEATAIKYKNREQLSPIEKLKSCNMKLFQTTLYES